MYQRMIEDKTDLVICDYYKLVDLTTNTINEISSNDENHQYVLYCLQIEKKRLIAIKFEV